MSRKPTLDDPIEIAKFWKNRQGEAVIVTLSTYEGRNLVDLRTHFTNKEGKLNPTPRGLSIVVLRLPELAAAVNKALAKARELGLLDPEASE
jgi:Transcriptional Coactivator p15 (PC4)